MGGSWSSSAGDLQDAIELADSLDIPEVWVMQGTYRPSSHPNLDGSSYNYSKFNHYSLRNGVTVIGGFDGDETSNTPTNGRDATVLSGDFSDLGFGYDDAYHVFFHYELSTALNSTAVLKNVTISGGSATIYVALSSTYSIHTLGGGMCNVGASPLLIDCAFSANTAYKSGGGIYNSSSSPVFVNCYIADNSITISAADEGGAGMHNVSNSNPVCINTIFLNNDTPSNGGGVYNSQGSDANSTTVLLWEILQDQFSTVLPYITETHSQSFIIR